MSKPKTIQVTQSEVEPITKEVLASAIVKSCDGPAPQRDQSSRYCCSVAGQNETREKYN